LTEAASPAYVFRLKSIERVYCVNEQRGNDEAGRKDFDDVKKRANADVYRGRSFVPVEKRKDKRPKPVSDPE
jgi:hypothetical protein